MKEQCSYSRHPCTRFRYRDYKFCFQHILEDKCAPFMPCQYISSTTSRRCHNPALKSDCNNYSNKMLCEIHQQSTYNISSKRSGLSQSYVGSSPAQMRKLQSKYTGTTDGGNVSDNMGDLIDNAFEYDAETNSKWLTSLSPSWKSIEPDIDAESSDDDDNPLKNAGAYSLEEVASNTKRCLVKLQSLYVKQLGHLNRRLQAKYRRHLLNKDQNADPGENNSSQADREEKKNSAELNALLSYRRHTGVDLLMHRQAKRRRLEATKGSAMIHVDGAPTKARCSHVSNHSRCKGTCLPYTKYCVSHILEDPLQMLFKKCSFDSCSSPVCLLPYAVKHKSEDKTCYCPLHEPIAPISENLLSTLEKIKSFSSQKTVEVSSWDGVAIKEKAVLAPAVDETEKFKLKESSLTYPQEDAVQGQEIFSDSFALKDSSKAISGSDEREIKDFLTIEKDELPPQLPQAESVSPPIDETGDVTGDTLVENESTTTSVDRIAEANIEQFKTGRCFVLSQVSLCNKEDLSTASALQLQPLDSNTEAMLVKQAVTKVQNPQYEIPFNQRSNLPSVILDVSQDDEKSSSASAEVHHHGSIMSISSVPLGSNLIKQPKQGSHRIAASATLVPPVETSSDVAGAETNLQIADSSFLVDSVVDSQSETKAMPSLVPIVSTDEAQIRKCTDILADSESEMDNSIDDSNCTGAKDVDDSNTQSANASTLKQYEKPSETSFHDIEHSSCSNSDATDEVPTDDDDTIILKESGTETDNITIDKAGAPPVSMLIADYSTDSSLHDNNATEQSSPDNERKPSSADEETAIASLLSLSSGAAPNGQKPK